MILVTGSFSYWVTKRFPVSSSMYLNNVIRLYVPVKFILDRAVLRQFCTVPMLKYFPNQNSKDFLSTITFPLFILKLELFMSVWLAGGA